MKLFPWLARSVLVVWELPQNVLGAASLVTQLVVGGVRGVRVERERVLIETSGVAVSLGLFVFYSVRDSAFVPVGPENEAHEYGHSIQSRWLGPLYLPVIGVPSVCRALYAVLHRVVRGRRWPHYYDGFPEDWADRLGGVDRAQRPPP